MEEITTTLSKIDHSKWQYNAEDNVYYQIGISYAETPVDAEQQTLSIFVSGDYLNATDNGDGTYTVEINAEATIGNYTAETAPIVIPINTSGYSAMAALIEYTSSASQYTSQGFIYVSAGLRGRDSGAPAGVTDAKAAIRYLRYSDDTIAGTTDRIFVFGMSGGGAQSAIIGASGDSELYTAYLEEIGAVSGVSDAVAGVMAWCPITSLDYANEAYEWNLGSSRTDLDEETQALSDGLATAYANYLNELGLTDSQGNVLTLETSETGIYQSGSYYDYLKSVIEDSLNTFLANTTFPYTATSTMRGPGGGTPLSGEMPSGEKPNGGAPEQTESSEVETESSESMEETTTIEAVDNIQRISTENGVDLSGTYESVEDYIAALNANGEWVTYDSESNTVTIASIEDFVNNLKTASKSVGAFDALDASQGENELFGYGDGGVHFDSVMAELLAGTEYEEAYATDLAKTDTQGNSVQTRIDMYNPMYYLEDYYDGYQTSTVATHWRIRTGINQGDTALTTEVNLALALEAYGVDTVDFETVWGQGHTQAEVADGDSTSNFIEWVNEVLAQ